jgi:5-methylcytosine-specific restriction endonuclease McrA
MSGHVLVLNQDYSVLTLCSVERAVILLLLQKADLVEALPDQFVRSPNRHLPWPSIVRLKAYVAVPYKRIMISRKNILRRDRYRCQYCASRDRLTVDHVLPRSRGGKDSWENLVVACTPCNNKKGSRTPDEAGMQLIRRPFRPTHVMFIRDYIGTVNEAWKPYLFLV